SRVMTATCFESGVRLMPSTDRGIAPSCSTWRAPRSRSTAYESFVARNPSTSEPSADQTPPAPSPNTLRHCTSLASGIDITETPIESPAGALHPTTQTLFPSGHDPISLRLAYQGGIGILRGVGAPAG